MSYKDALRAANAELGRDPRARFIGYGLKRGRALGTLVDVNDKQIVETPIAENLMIGLAIGLSLKGYMPIVFIERMDFILNALDAIVNHLDKMQRISNGEFAPAVIIRAVVGNKHKPLYTGLPHIQDYTEALKKMLLFSVAIFRITDHERIQPVYDIARRNYIDRLSTLIVEYKDLM